MVSAEGIGSLLEGGTQYVADCKGDVPLCARLPYISGTSLQERVLVPSGLKDDDSSLVVTEQVKEFFV